MFYHTTLVETKVPPADDRKLLRVKKYCTCIPSLVWVKKGTHAKGFLSSGSFTRMVQPTVFGTVDLNTSGFGCRLSEITFTAL